MHTRTFLLHPPPLINCEPRGNFPNQTKNCPAKVIRYECLLHCKNASVKCVIAARSTENVADSCANDDDIMNDDGRHIFSKLEICNKPNKLFSKS